MEETIKKFIADKKQGLIDHFEQNKDALADFNEKVRQFNQHRDKISQPYKLKMERIKRNFDMANDFSQSLFVYSYSFLFLKMIFFNHYSAMNLPIKFSLVCLYSISLEPLTLASCNFIFYLIF